MEIKVLLWKRELTSFRNIMKIEICIKNEVWHISASILKTQMRRAFPLKKYLFCRRIIQKNL